MAIIKNGPKVGGALVEVRVFILGTIGFINMLLCLSSMVIDWFTGIVVDVTVDTE